MSTPTCCVVPVGGSAPLCSALPALTFVCCAMLCTLLRTRAARACMQVAALIGGFALEGFLEAQPDGDAKRTVEERAWMCVYSSHAHGHTCVSMRMGVSKGRVLHHGVLHHGLLHHEFWHFRVKDARVWIHMTFAVVSHSHAVWCSSMCLCLAR